MPLPRYWLLGLLSISCFRPVGIPVGISLEISDVRITQQFIDLKKVELDTISFVLNRTAEIRVQIWNARGYLVKNLYEGRAKRRENVYTWNFQDNNGNRVADGDYYVTITAYTRNEEANYDPFRLSWGNPVQPSDGLINLADLRLYYVLPTASLVRIRAGVLSEALLHATIVNWEPRPAGPNFETWDGYDNSKLVDVAHKPNTEYEFEAFSLPQSVIIIKNSDGEAKDYSVKRSLPSTEGAHRHSHHLREECFDPTVGVTFLNIKRYKEEVPVLEIASIFRVAVPEPALEFMESERFEIIIFVDGEFYFEEENGYSPYDYRLESSELSEGRHTLTAVVVSSEDHAGSASVQFYYDKRRNKCCAKKQSP